MLRQRHHTRPTKNNVYIDAETTCTKADKVIGMQKGVVPFSTYIMLYIIVSKMLP